MRISESVAKEIGVNIGRVRAEYKESQQELADYLGVERQTVTHWENGKRGIDLNTLIKIASRYGVTLDYLVKGTGRYDADLIEKGKDALGISEEAFESIKRLFQRDSGKLADFLDELISDPAFPDTIRMMQASREHITKLYYQIADHKNVGKMVTANAKIAYGEVISCSRKIESGLFALLGYDRFEELMKGSETDGE